MFARFSAIFILLSSFSLFGLSQTKGKVVDAEDGEPMPFVHIQLKGSSKGTLSGLDGTFSIQAQPNDSLVFQYLGYKSQTLAAKGLNLVRMENSDVALEGVVIHPDVNPAIRIMDLVEENKQENDPNKREKYQFQSYNKLKAKPIYPDNIPDSNRIKFPIFLTETVAERIQHRPGKVQERIISARVSGYPGQVLPFTASDLQDLSFYGNYIKVMGQAYLSPVAKEARSKYHYELQQVIANGADTIFQVSFKPKRETFYGFEGMLMVDNRRWAITAVEAKLLQGDKNGYFEGGQVRQVYQEQQPAVWLPWQIFTDVTSRSYAASMPIKFYFEGFSELSQGNPEEELPKFRTEVGLELSPDAGREDSLLQNARTETLDSLEQRTYKVLDSIGEASHLDWVFKQTYKIQDNRIGFGPVDVMLDKIISGNKVEKYRIGLGLSTNEVISTRFRVNGYGGYGLGDKEWKYGGSLELFPLANPFLFAGASYQNDLVETGFRRLGIRPERELYKDQYAEFGIRAWYLERMDYVETKTAWLGGSPFRGLSMMGTVRQEKMQPAFEYSLSDSGAFLFEEAELMLKWAPGISYAKKGKQWVQMRNKLPILTLRYAQGRETELTNLEYQSVAASLSYQFPILGSGRIRLEAFAGANDKSLPIQRMHTYRGSYAKKNPTALVAAFNTMRYGEFASDIYAEGFVYFRPKLNWLRFGKSIKPQLDFSLAAAWGELYSGSQHMIANLPVSAPNHIYLEPGITLSRLLPMKDNPSLMSTLINSFGVNFSYRSGYYTFPDWRENLVFRLQFGI